MKRMMTTTVAMAMVLAVGTASAGFVGAWVNIDSTPDMLARVDINSTMLLMNIHPWGQCTPLCDWGVKSVSVFSVTGNQFSLAYDFPFKTVSLTLTLVSENSLWVHEFHDYAPGDLRTDFALDEYFQREGSGTPLPDLVVSELTIPKPVVVYGAVPWTWVTAKVRNDGPGILSGGTIKAALDSCTLNGASFAHSGFIPFDYTAPLMPGQEITHDFAVGTNVTWPVGCHTIRLKVDSDNTIAESNEQNNLSEALSFDMTTERFLAGTVTYNHQPLSTKTSLSPTDYWIRNTGTGETLTGYDFQYIPSTGHYLISGLPNATVMVVMRFESGGGYMRPGNFEVAETINLPAVSDADAGDYEMPVRMYLHLTEPWDNQFTAPTTMQYNCRPIRLAWEAVPGATKYRVKLDLYRDAEHPSGYGLIIALDDRWTTELSYEQSIAPSAELEHYQFNVTGYNDADELLGKLMITFVGGYGADYRFKVCASCARSDINHDCRVNLMDLGILAEEWLVDTR